VKTALDMRQFIVVVSTLNKSVSVARIASMYRDAYDAAAGGVTIQRFFGMAEKYVQQHDRLVLSVWARCVQFITSIHASIGSSLPPLHFIDRALSDSLSRSHSPDVTLPCS
jgi:hypothetical protein